MDQPHLFEPPPSIRLTLEDRFLVPPFSVLDARQGYWKERKRQWATLGIEAELGREVHLLHASGDDSIYSAAGREQGIGGFASEADRRQVTEGSAYPRGGAAKDEALRAELAAQGITSPEAVGEGGLYSHEGREAGLTGGLAGHGNPKGMGASLLKSGEGRGDRLLSGATPREGYGGDYNTAEGENAWGGAGTSIFDPVLCELVYRWFVPEGGRVLDPYAGGSVRGIVAAHLGLEYHGVDLRPEQCEANEAQATRIGAAHGWRHQPMWYCGDSREVLPKLTAGTYDLVFSCPPYYDLEQYSDDPRDLSNAKDYEAFAEAYTAITVAAVGALKPDRYAIYVVGEVRNKQGNYYGLVPTTIASFEAAGASYYNEGILVTAVGSLPIRTSRLFGPGRKLGKTHQNILGFVKGDGKAAARACPMPAEVAVEYGGATWTADSVAVPETGEEVAFVGEEPGA